MADTVELYDGFIEAPSLSDMVTQQLKIPKLDFGKTNLKNDLNMATFNNGYTPAESAMMPYSDNYLKNLGINKDQRIELQGAYTAANGLGTLSPSSPQKSTTNSMLDKKLYDDTSSITQWVNNPDGKTFTIITPDGKSYQADANGKKIDNNNNNTWGYKEWGTVGNIGLGVGQLGLGLASYLTNKQVAEKQMRLLDQQYANNADLIAARKAKRENIRSAFA